MPGNLDPVDVDAAGNWATSMILPSPRRNPCSCRLELINQRGNMPSEKVVDQNTHITISVCGIADSRRWIEWIGVVLVYRKLHWLFDLSWGIRVNACHQNVTGAVEPGHYCLVYRKTAIDNTVASIRPFDIHPLDRIGIGEPKVKLKAVLG